MRTRLNRVFRGADITSDGRPTDRWDWIITLTLAGLVVLELVLDPPARPVLEFMAAFAALLVLPFRRQIPIHAMAVAFGVQLVVELISAATGEIGEVTYAHGIAGFFLIYALCRWPAVRATAVGMVVAMGMVLVGEFLDGDVWWENLLVMVPWLVLGLFALAMRYRAALDQQHDQQVRLAERNALARELHDSVAHHVSAIAVQAQAAQFVVETNPNAAIEAMGAVEDIANTAIDEMRRLVGILRSENDEARTVAPTDLPALADPSGTPRVNIVGETDLSTLPGPVAAAVYRIAQESITNARRHSRNVTFVDVNLVIDSDTATVEIMNDGTPTTRSRGGYGLIGMTERVESLNGSISVGPQPTTGWRVLASVPLGRAS